MGGVFSGKSVDVPKVKTEVPAIPIEEEKPSKRRRARGRLETILTGELAPVTRKKTLLGGA